MSAESAAFKANGQASELLVHRPDAPTSFDDFLRVAERECNTVFSGDAEMEALAHEIYDLRNVDAVKTLLGTPGSGKEGIAMSIHMASRRAGGNFVPLNAATLRGDLLEAKLFGHRAGAFTDAKRAEPGAAGLADGGTLFVDEVGEMPETAQIYALRLFSADRKVKAVGSSTEFHLNANIVFATNSGLGHLRSDFRSRLMGCVLVVPIFSKRETAHRVQVIKNLALRMPVPCHVEKDAIEFLLSFNEEGDVRWMHDRIAIAAGYAANRMSNHIEKSDLERAVQMYRRAQSFGSEQPPGAASYSFPIDGQAPNGNTYDFYVKQLAQKLFSETLQRHNGNIHRSASELGIARETLKKYMVMFGMCASTNTPVD